MIFILMITLIALITLMNIYIHSYDNPRSMRDTAKESYLRVNKKTGLPFTLQVSNPNNPNNPDNPDNLNNPRVIFTLIITLLTIINPDDPPLICH